jgi:multidrug transporter EmrE-like cation transporter
MFYLVLSIICSVSVGVIFKISRRYEICTTQIVTWNYALALCLCYLFFVPNLAPVTASAPWEIYLPLMFLLPSVFMFLAISIKHMGIVKTDVAQRLSLFIPILAAWLIFKEDFNTLKIVGLAIGFPAVLFILAKKSDQNNGNKWAYPAIVLVGFGIIDILFKQVALYNVIPYTTSLFVVFAGAFSISLLTVVYQVIIRGVKLRIINFAFGTLVGIFNFGNILFYLKAHKAFSESPSTVFAAMNIGVILLGSIAGILIFKERMSKYNYAGLALAVVSIVLIALSQIN